jgi:hypothetical protein
MFLPNSIQVSTKRMNQNDSRKSSVNLAPDPVKVFPGTACPLFLVVYNDVRAEGRTGPQFNSWMWPGLREVGGIDVNRLVNLRQASVLVNPYIYPRFG